MSLSLLYRTRIVTRTKEISGIARRRLESRIRKKLMSYIGKTRKIVNYICWYWSQEKFWWKILVVLMFNSLTRNGYRGERPNELSGSWFQSKCLSGQRL